MDANAKVTLVGAGLLGHALALVHAAGGHQVKMQDISEKQLEVGVVLIDSALSTMVDAGAITAAEKAATLSRITPVPKLADAVGDADLVVEAVVENLSLIHI